MTHKIFSNKMPKVFGLIISIAIFTSCSDYLDVDNKSEIPNITNTIEANSALNGVYARMKTSYYYGADVITYGDVKGDDMATTKSGDRTSAAYQFATETPLNYTNVGYFWQYMYDELNRVNNLIAVIDSDSNNELAKTDDEKKTLKNISAQAYALRALAHFNLARIHAKPYTIDKNSLGVVLAKRVINKNESPIRSTVEETYNFIVEDLNKAINSGDLSTSNDPFYINQWSAKSLLARVYLSMGEWEKAYNLSVEVIESGKYSLIKNADYVDSWSKDETTESIFEIKSSDSDNANREGIGFLMKPRTSSPKGYGAISLSDQFINLIQKDSLTDVRWKLIQKGDYNNPHGYLAKYPGRSGNLYVNNARVIRLSDVYLMAAEAGVKSGKIAGASKYLNDIRKRANPLLKDTIATKELVAIERRKELVGEGTRYFDILRTLNEIEPVKRTGIANFPVTSKMMPIIDWKNGDAWKLIMPIPSAEVEANKLIQQNPGY